MRKPTVCPQGHFTSDPEVCGTCEAEQHRIGNRTYSSRPSNGGRPPSRGQYQKRHVNMSGVAKGGDKQIAAEWAMRPKDELNENRIFLAAQRDRVARMRASGIKVEVR